MNCTIPVGNLRILIKALQTLSKIGDELYIEVTKNSLLFRSINANKTVFSSIEFFDSFFTCFDVAEFATETEENPELACKIQMKAVLAIFKPSLKDKNLTFCQIELQHKGTDIFFKLQYKFDASVMHKVHLLDMESWHLTYSKDSLANEIVATGHCFLQVLSNFQLNDDDLSLEALQQKLIMRNYDVGEQNTMKVIRSQYVLNAIEFNSFKISQPTNITFSLKPFRAAVQFSEHFNLNLLLKFETAGKPAFIVIKNPTFELNVVTATIGPDGSTQTSISTSSAPSLPKRQSIPNQNNKANLTIEDKEALENEDWEEDCLNDDRNNYGGVPKPTFSSLFSESSNKNDTHELSQSPKSKRIKMIFGRCYENTFREENLNYGNVIVPNSDVESD